MRHLLVAAALGLGLAGCNHYEPLSLHGAASMRVEVEVYKGPLTVPVNAQAGELVAVVSDSVRVLFAWREGTRAAIEACRADDPDCAMLRAAANSTDAALSAACWMIDMPNLNRTLGPMVYVPVSTCAAVRGGVGPAEAEQLGLGKTGTAVRTYQDMVLNYTRRLDAYVAEQRRIADGGATPTPATPGGPTLSHAERIRAGERAMQAQRLLDIVHNCPAPAGTNANSLDHQLKCQSDVISIASSNYAAMLQGAAKRVADGTLARMPSTPERRMLIEFANLASDYGGQVHARIAVLHKQLAEDRTARTLPVSDYLRGSERTDYLQLFDWLNAAGGAASLSPQDRIRMAQRLTADGYWQKVNEVYASGQGDTAMAFVKDDLGNWDLKSFSNDPSELLGAYRDVANAALKTAADLAKSAAGGAPGQAGRRLLDATKAAALANQIATGEVADAGLPGGIDLATLRAGVVRRLEAQKKRFGEVEEDLTEALKAAKKAEQDAEGVVSTARDKSNRADGAVTDARTLLNERMNSLSAASSARRDAEAQNTGVAAAGDTERAAAKAADEALTALKDATDKASAAQTALMTAQGEAAEAKAEHAALEKRLKDLPEEAALAARGTFEDYLDTLVNLQAAISPATTASATPTVPALPRP